MPVTFCDQCDQFIDLDEDVSHVEDHDQDEQTRWLEDNDFLYEMHEAYEERDL